MTFCDSKKGEDTSWTIVWIILGLLMLIVLLFIIGGGREALTKGMNKIKDIMRFGV